ncbi:MerR family transcriptional regulator [Micropruina sp.]|uniref:MerR family transcriptional regulator n=1 Tax=Micropruina sp. TaxID=2737536 RepID=UPI0039E38C6F
MIWSPRELAELAGTTRRTVRHYHEIGLLPEPTQQSNGYRLYGVEHLLRLLRIRRLTQLGLTLNQIAAIGDSVQPPAQMLRDLDTRLVSDIEHLQETRLEVAAMLEHAVPSDLPPELSRRVADLPGVERALVVGLTRLLDEPGLEAYLTLLPPYRDNAAVVAFDHLPDDAGPEAREAVVAGLADHLEHLDEHCPGLTDLISRPLQRSPAKQRTVDEVVADLYNDAQLDVLVRVRRRTGRSRPRWP